MQTNVARRRTGALGPSAALVLLAVFGGAAPTRAQGEGPQGAPERPERPERSVIEKVRRAKEEA